MITSRDSKHLEKMAARKELRTIILLELRGEMLMSHTDKALHKASGRCNHNHKCLTDVSLILHEIGTP